MQPEIAGRAGVADAARKPMTSQVNWALLGLLMERPGYGYQLMQRFERAYGDVLPLGSVSHIYTALNELRGRGFIKALTDARGLQSGTERQPKQSYQATVEGARRFRERMLAQAWEDRRQSRLFVRQLAVFEHEPGVALEILDGYEKACLREASHMPPAAGGLADRLLTEESRLAIEGRLPWVEYARSEFGALGRGHGDESA
jgi:DNA-binding PadR family transcriptional regulator